MAIVKPIMAFIKRYPVLTYFVLTFAISWGGFVLVVGPGSFPGTGSQFDTITPYVVMAMLAGPTISGLALTGLVSGRAGYRELLSRLLRWRVGARWYAVALLIAPLLAWALLAVFSLTPPVFTTGDKAAFVLTGVVAGLVGGLFEELGWTGFAVPRLRLRHGILATGLIVGIPWGAWHLLQGLWIGGTYAGTVPLGLFLVLNFLSGIAELTAFRILMMWVYDRTESLLIVALMHASLITGTIFLFTPMATGMLGLAYAWSLNAALWLLVGVVVAANHGHLARQPFARPVI